MKQLVRDLGNLATSVVRLLDIRVQYYNAAGWHLGWAGALAVEDAEAKVRAITGCSAEEARAHVVFWVRLERKGLVLDPLGAAVRVLASGGELMGQEGLA